MANQFVLGREESPLRASCRSDKREVLLPSTDANCKVEGETREMPLAFVLISAEVGSENEALKELKAIEQVKDAYMVYGVYDIVAKIQAETMDKLKEVITRKVRRLNKINSTLTMMVIE
jgi:DNA-binding Lrp family transcriptional regulator